MVEMAIVLLILGLALGMVLNLTGGMRDAQNRQLVRTQLQMERQQAVQLALLDFLRERKRFHRDRRLPYYRRKEPAIQQTKSTESFPGSRSG